MNDTDYKIGNYIFDASTPIGKGKYGTVYKAMRILRTNDEPAFVALKVIDRSKFSNETQFLNMLEVLQSIKGKYLVETFDCFKTTESYYLIMEYCDGINMEERIKQRDPLTVDHAKRVLKQIAKSFLDMESMALMHRDIKPENIIEDFEGNIKLTDYNFSTLVEPMQKYLRKNHPLAKGTPYYMSPQILGCEDYSCKTDVWSAGVTIYELLFCKVPWEACSPLELFQKINEIPLQFPKDYNLDVEFQELLRSMLKIEEDDRLSWEEIYHHPALEKIEV